MTRYVALLRAVNVGGTGMLPMATLRALCGAAGFRDVATYIASGNALFTSSATPARVRAELEARLNAHLGKPIAVVVRTAAEMAAVRDANPFGNALARHSYVIFLHQRPARDALAHMVGHSDEEVRLGAREIFVHYPRGMGRSKLKIAAARDGTARNMATVAKLAELAAQSAVA
jgi:uncharacterized protein (DUF1697 family)